MPGKGPEGKAACAASIGGISAFHSLPAGLPQRAAETRKEGSGEIAEFPAPDRERYVPHDCKQDDFPSGTLKSQGILNRPTL